MVRSIYLAAAAWLFLLPVFAGETLNTATFEQYQASMNAIRDTEGQAVAQKAAIALMTIAWQATAPGVAMAEWTKSMSSDRAAWLAAIAPFEGMTASELIAARDALPPFEMWP